MRQRHRSFVLTQPEYMKGKRVKPRLRYLAYASAFFVLVEVLACFIGSIILYANLGRPLGGWVGVVISVAILLVLRLIAHLTFFILRKLFVRLDFMTPDEAQSFPPPRNGWPESWLEPMPTKHDNASQKAPL